jgi:hypothetical protein
MRETRKTVAAVIVAGQQRGELDPALDGEKVASQLMRVCLGTVLMWSLHEDPPLTEWMEESFQHYWRSIAASGGKQA